MAFKAVFFCVSVVLVQQSIAGPYYPTPSCGCSTPKMSIRKTEEISHKPSYSPCKDYSINSVSIDIPTSGGAFTVTSIGPIAPSGIAVATDVGLTGELELSGVLPYLSAVAFEGAFDACGAVPVAYGCGCGDSVAITEQIGGASYGPAISSCYGAGFGPSYVSNVGCGC